MDYQTLYRRWRPRDFNDFVGQSHVVTTLSNAIEANRVAHAYLFTGPRGTGKTSTAKIFAKALNCESPKGFQPCDECSCCTRINEGTFLDVLEIDGASNRGIDEIRDLREKVKFAPAEGKYKIYIIDEVHMLTAEAFNALLKTLEEPPKFVVFILATTEVHKIPPTILSRCQRFDFKRFTTSEITGRLLQILESEGVVAEDNALRLIAEHSEGGMRDAISLLEQALAHREDILKESDVRAILGLIDDEIILRISDSIRKRDTREALTILGNVAADGKDLFQFGRSLIIHFRKQLLNGLTTDLKEKDNLENDFSTEDIIHIIEILAAANNEVKRSLQSSLPLELAFIKLTTVQASGNDLETRVAKLEKLLQGQLQPRSRMNSAEAEPAKSAGLSVTTSKSPDIPISPAINLAKGNPQTEFAQWPEFLEAVKKKKRTLAALIQEGKPVSFNGDLLVVGLPPQLKFHLENLMLPQNKELLESVIQETCGKKICLSCIPMPDEAEAKIRTEETPSPLNEAVRLFGGEVRPLQKEE